LSCGPTLLTSCTWSFVLTFQLSCTWRSKSSASSADGSATNELMTGSTYPVTSFVARFGTPGGAAPVATSVHVVVLPICVG
jgi:hypothetical protein